MQKVSKEYIQAVQFVNGCGGDIQNALDRLENLIDQFFIARQRQKADYVEKLVVIIKKGL